jgi:type I restriction enzyme S subunit
MTNKKWNKIPLKKLCSRIGDGLHGTPDYVSDSKIYFINGNNLKNGKIEITSDTKKVTESELAKNFIPLNENSLLLSINGTIGSMAFYDGEKVMLGKSAAYLNFNSNVNQFYYYYFQLKGVQEFFYYVATGSTIKNLSLKSIQDFEVPVPEESERNGIVSTLKSLDAKIELNNKINRELEAMAKTLYDYWFVQFDFPDPSTSSGQAGKPYKSSGGKMVYNAELKREIPEGWEVKELNKCVELIIDHRGKTPTKLGGDWSYDNDAIIALSAKIVKGGKLVNIEQANKVSIDLYNKWMPKKLQNGDILMTSEAPAGEFYFIYDFTEYCLSQRLFALRAKSNLLIPSYFYYELSKGHGYSQIQGSLSGSTVFGIRQDVLRTIKVVVPEFKMQERFNAKVLPLLRQIKKLDLQNQHLSALRDWLLPMLINGQVSVRQAYGEWEAEQSMSMAAEPEAEYTIGKK